MDKIFSARLDESVIQQVALLSRKLKTSKKAIIEAAVRLYSEQSRLKGKVDALENTCGVWERQETPQEDILASRTAFNQSMERHHAGNN